MRSTSSPERAPSLDGLAVDDAFLGPGEQRALLSRLRGIAYDHVPYGPAMRRGTQAVAGDPMPRGYFQFGRAYDVRGRRLPVAPPIPGDLEAVGKRAWPADLVGSPINMCVAMHYPPGVGIGWHTDGARFGEWVVGMSLGAPARMQFRAPGSEALCAEVDLPPGSLYRMRGFARWELEHRIVPVESERYSVTFRSNID